MIDRPGAALASYLCLCRRCVRRCVRWVLTRRLMRYGNDVIYLHSCKIQNLIAMSFICIKVHCVWATKYRAPLLQDPSLRKALFIHIYENAHEKGIYLDTIGGWIDHVHCLISLRATQSIAQVMQQLKGESAHWYNSYAIARGFNPGLKWQTEYFAQSVGDDRLEIVRRYIRNQESHHAHRGTGWEDWELINLSD